MICKTALAIAALTSLPVAHASTETELDQVRAKSLGHLVSQQKGDGGWRDADLNGVQATASALIALTNSGIKIGYALGAAVAWLMNENASSTDSLARQVAALARHDVVANHLIAGCLTNNNLIDDRWGAYRGYQGSMAVARGFVVQSGEYPWALQNVSVTSIKQKNTGSHRP